MVEAEMRRRGLRNLNPQEVSNFAWSVATSAKNQVNLCRQREGAKSVVREAGKLLEAIEGNVVRGFDLTEFSSQEISNLLWAFARINHGCPAFYNQVTKEIVRRELGGFSSQEICNIAWAWGMSENLLRSFRSNSEPGVLVQRQLNLLLNRPSARPPPRKEFVMLESEALRRQLGIRKGSNNNNQDLCNIAGAFAKADYISLPYFRMVHEHLSKGDLWHGA
eukprot:CAMPEP_0113668282 /NCGR_PEP_ID=MMETSP0038_2-20120614/3914_1 /TAXON_ID=2898 /ORGANISM="Cryptomonas paramecium" /LENGTH=220 /DNA_ID=CAMNT_0000584009 /DNA_START=66 /DNA_END=724 /DNA_ORIENTATION=- /assembly_acc=CAM_ASM_000170